MNILPTAQVGGNEPGFFGANYDFASEMPTPGAVGVRRDDSLGSVMDAAKGAAFYVDMIGFGEPSNDLTRSLGLKPSPLGINYFIRTGIRCSNGADMWHYVEGIPTGKAFGGRLKNALAESKLPALRGLAPGILEDAQDALDPRPVMNSVLGSGYPKCKRVELPVGDSSGKLGVPGEEPWITGAVNKTYGYPTQIRWVQDTDRNGNPIYLTRSEFEKEPKTFCPDGTAMVAGKPCSGAVKEGFSTERTDRPQLIVAVALSVMAFIAIVNAKLR